MEQIKHCRYHPSIAKFTYVLEVKTNISSKYWYNNASECAQKGLAFGQSKYGQDLLNVHIYKDEKKVESWK